MRTRRAMEAVSDSAWQSKRVGLREVAKSQVGRRTECLAKRCGHLPTHASRACLAHVCATLPAVPRR